MPTVLVTGAAGFVGRHLVPRLVAAGWGVRACYRWDLPAWAAAPAAAESGPAVAWIKCGDLRPDSPWEALLEGVDAVVHLAALAHRLPGTRRAPTEADFDLVNRAVTAALAQAWARRDRPGRLVFLSSIGAVTEQAEQPVSEAVEPRPVSAYGRSKRAAELEVARALAAGPADFTILRPPLVQGPGNPGNLARLETLLRRGWPLPLAGLRNRRSLVQVGHLAEAIATVLTHAAASRRTFHVADREVLSTPELLRALSARLGCPLRLWQPPAALLQLLLAAADLLGSVTGRGRTLGTHAWERLAGSLEVDARALTAATGWEPTAVSPRAGSAPTS